MFRNATQKAPRRGGEGLLASVTGTEVNPKVWMD